MKLVIIAGVAVLAAVAVQAAAAQKPKPIFSGTWVVVSPEKGKGVEQIVTHDAKILTVENSRQGPSMRQTYQLDGLEHKTTLAARGAQIGITYRAVWDASTLVITSTQSYPNGMNVQMKDIWSIDAKGQLVIDSSESGPGGSGPSVKIIHTRKMK